MRNKIANLSATVTGTTVNFKNSKKSDKKMTDGTD